MGGACVTGETTLYSCRFASGSGSVCLSPTALHYRFRGRGRRSVDVANSPSWDNVHIDTQYGQGDGYQTHVRFTAGAYHYIVFEGVAGQLSDIAGQSRSGIDVQRGDRPLGTLECPRRAFVRSDWTKRVLSRVPEPARGRVLDEEERFRAWF